MGASTSPSAGFRKSVVLLFCAAAAVTAPRGAEAASAPIPAPTSPVLTDCGKPITMGFDVASLTGALTTGNSPIPSGIPTIYSDTQSTTPLACPLPKIFFSKTDGQGNVLKDSAGNPIGGIGGLNVQLLGAQEGTPVTGGYATGNTSSPEELVFGGITNIVTQYIGSTAPFVLTGKLTAGIMSSTKTVVTGYNGDPDTSASVGTVTFNPGPIPTPFMTGFAANQFAVTSSVPASAIQVSAGAGSTQNLTIGDDFTIQFVPPETPFGLTGTVASNAINFTWPPTPNADSYNVYVNGVRVATGLTTSSYAAAGTPGVQLCGQVTSVNFAGESAATQQVCNTPNTLPGQPQNLQVLPGNGFVTVSWTQNPTVTYSAYAGPKGAETFQGNPTTNPYQIPGNNGTQQCVVFTASNSAGTSLPSNEVCATPLAGVAAEPVESPASGTTSTTLNPITVTVSGLSKGETAVCTQDGTTPTPTSPSCSNITLSIPGTYIVKAMGIQKGYANSPVVTGTYVVTAPPVTAKPVIGLPSGTYTGPQSVTITAATSGAVIYYTTNGTTPTTASNVYNGPLTVSSSETLEASALAPLNTMSPTAIAAYTINAAPLPTLPQATMTPTPCKGGQIETISVPEATAISYKLNDGAVTAYNSAGVSIPTNGGTLVVTATASGHQASTTSFTCAAAVATDNPPPASPPPATGGGTSGGAVGPVVLGGLVGLAFWRRRYEKQLKAA